MKFSNHSILLLTVAASLALTTTGYSHCGECAGDPKAGKAHSHATADIVTTAKKAGNFNTLLAAAKAAGLVDTLKGNGPLTVFAPTDDAFAKLPEGTVESLMKPKNVEKLRTILTYHVVAAKVTSREALKAGKAKTVQGGTVTIQASGDEAKVNNANLVALDIETSNGIIHVIDRVLMPPPSASAKAVSGRRMIDMAIERGVPLYNSGQASACAAVYEIAAHAVMEIAGDELCDSSRKRMEMTMSRLDRVHNAGDRAWMLRNALDAAHGSLMN